MRLQEKRTARFIQKNTLNPIRYGLSSHLMAENKVSIIEDVEVGFSN